MTVRGSEGQYMEGGSVRGSKGQYKVSMSQYFVVNVCKCQYKVVRDSTSSEGQYKSGFGSNKSVLYVRVSTTK